jgi:hypothetical protein
MECHWRDLDWRISDRSDEYEIWGMSSISCCEKGVVSRRRGNIEEKRRVE